MSPFFPVLRARCAGYEVNFATHSAKLWLDGPPDMRGAIRFCQQRDASVKVINTFTDGEPSTTFERDHGAWTAHGPLAIIKEKRKCKS